LGVTLTVPPGLAIPVKNCPPGFLGAKGWPTRPDLDRSMPITERGRCGIPRRRRGHGRTFFRAVSRGVVPVHDHVDLRGHERICRGNDGGSRFIGFPPPSDIRIADRFSSSIRPVFFVFAQGSPGANAAQQLGRSARRKRFGEWVSQSQANSSLLGAGMGRVPGPSIRAAQCRASLTRDGFISRYPFRDRSGGGTGRRLYLTRHPPGTHLHSSPPLPGFFKNFSPPSLQVHNESASSSKKLWASSKVQEPQALQRRVKP